MEIRIAEVEYEAFKDAIRSLRFSVFVEEQGVPAELEMDSHDRESTHVLAFQDEVPVATGRLLKDGHIGRVAVLKECRGLGVGASIMAMLEEIARLRGIREIEISSQVQAVDFYRGLGYAVVGDVYYEAGIEHLNMSKPLSIR